MNSDTFIIARAGWNALGISLALFVIFTIIDADFFQAVAFIAALAIAWMYRNPERAVPYFQSKSIVSPADGTVTAIETVEECALCKEPCYKIEITSGWLDTSILRAPFEAEIDDINIRRGARLNLAKPLAKELNERACVTFVGKEDERLFIEHLLEQNPADLAMDVHAEQRVMQGGRYGTMLKGKTTLYLPVNSRINLHVGDRLRAGESLIGYFSSKDEQ